MSSDLISELSSSNFDSVVSSNNAIVLVDFWAAWCGPCRMMLPILDEIANELSGVKNFKICKVNVDNEPEIATKYRVTSIPFFVLFKNGKPFATKVGGSSKTVFLDWIKSNAGI